MSRSVRIHRGDGYQAALLMLDHKDAYRNIRNYLAGRFIGATRDEALLEEVIKCLFCKLHLKRQRGRLGAEEDISSLTAQYSKAFSELRHLLPSIFRSEVLLLDSASLAYVDQMLEATELDNPIRDPIGDAYEIFIGSSIRGQEGQFFTPQNAVSLLVSVVDPRPGERVIDPACGAGGFLSAVARHLLAAGGSATDVAAHVAGIDKDRYLASLASSHLSLMTLQPAQICCADSLAWEAEEGEEFALKDKLGTFDVILTNPPFGARIVAASQEVQRSFDLGYRWKIEAKTGRWLKTRELQPSVPPQVLFIERCLSLVRPGGRIGMVVPESLVSGRNYRYVVDYMRRYADIKAVMGMPETLFKTSGRGGTHTKTCLLVLQKKDAAPEPKVTSVFMAEVQWCGHDSRARKIKRDELPQVARRFEAFRVGQLGGATHLGYEVPADQLVDNILAPRYYNPDINAELELLRETHELVKIGDLITAGVITITTGDEIGKLSYGTGSIPFVRTSDISNWEIKLDPKHGVSDEVYQNLARKQDVREGDILMVRDGTYLIGTCAYVTKYDEKIVFQSHLYKLRVGDQAALSPYLLLAALSSAPVQRQIKAKRFTQDIIDSLGDRIRELVLPIPKQAEVRERVTRMVGQAIQQRVEARELARQACVELIGVPELAVIDESI